MEDFASLFLFFWRFSGETGTTAPLEILNYGRTEDEFVIDCLSFVRAAVVVNVSGTDATELIPYSLL